jgi:hypothetical protein
MHARRPVHLALVAFLLTASVWARPAEAYHTDEEHLVSYTAHTLQKGELALGIWDAAWGPWEWLTVSTYTWPWIKQVVNLYAKARVWSNARWALAVKVGYVHVDMQALVDTESPASFHVTPIELALSRRLGKKWELSGAIVYTPIVAEGSYDDEDLSGALGFTNTQLTLALTYRVNKRWALFMRSRHLLSMDLSGQVHASRQIDQYTTVETHADATTDETLDMGFPQTWHWVPGVAWSRASFNLELGVGYGNFNVPGLNFVIPERWWVPSLDVYWRF